MKYCLIIFIITFITSVGINAQNFVKKFYYPDGKLQSQITYSDTVRDGDAKFYYENGNLKEDRNYVNGRIDGTVKLYHENGTLSEIYSIIDGKREGPTSVFDSTGNYLNDISYTSGKQEARNIELVSSQKSDSSFTARIDELKHSDHPGTGPPKLMEAQSNDDPTFFIKLDVQPRPISGMNDIYKKLVYPDEARKNNIKGRVDVLTFIDASGKVVDMTVIKGLGYGCDESAENAIRYTKFYPGLIKGKPVKSQLKISINF